MIPHLFSRPSLCLFALFVVISISVSGAAAADQVTLSFNDLGMGGSQEILIFNSSGHLISINNTDDTVVLNGTNETTLFYTIQIQPSPINIFTDPLQALPLIQAYIVGLLPFLVIGFAVLWFIFFRR